MMISPLPLPAMHYSSLNASAVNARLTSVAGQFSDFECRSPPDNEFKSIFLTSDLKSIGYGRPE
jgi:hypothetical protein